MPRLNEAQRDAVNSCGTNILVNASAGGGKTTVLIARLMKRIIEDKISLDEIIAMTFTSAASQNMKNRLSSALNEKLENASSDDEKNYLEDQIARLADAKISTIHSFCLSITKEYYYLIGITKDSCENIIDEAYAKLVLNDYVDQVINKYLEIDKEAVTNLSKAISSELFSFETLKKTILNIYSKASNKIQPLVWLDSLYDERKIDKFTDLDKNIRDLYLQELKTDLYSIRAAYQRMLMVDDCEQDVMAFKFQELEEMLECDDYPWLVTKAVESFVIPSKRSKSQEYKDMRDLICEQYANFTKKLIPSKVIVDNQNETRKFNNLLISMTRDVYVLYQQFKIDNEYIDFNDFEHYAYQILTMNDNKVANEFKKKIKEIMIDEFQDTNDIQFEMASLISNNNLFLVGDIKQSIYRFRNAKPAIMASLKNRADFKVIHIQNNYRSKANLVQFNNDLFNKIMNINQEAFDDKDAQIADLDIQLKDNVPIEFIYTDCDNPNSDNQEQLLANRIIELHKEENLAFKDIAVLVRSHREKTMIRKVFDDYNIPYFIADNEGYFNSYSMEILLSYINILLNKDDYISLVSVLTSRLYNYSDNDLAKIYKNWYENLKDSAFDHDYQILKSYVLNNDLENFLVYFLKINNFYNQQLDKQEKANIDLFIKSLNNHSFDSFADLVLFIKDTVENQKESAQFISEDADVVKVMTIHTSKGLEFDTVFLFSSTKNLFNEARDSVLIDDELGLGFKYSSTKYREKAETIGTRVINFKNNLEDIYEYQRLLYVALTRAKRRMIIVEALTPTTKENQMSEDKIKYPLDLSLLAARKGFSSYLYSAMYETDKWEIKKLYQLPEITALPSLAKAKEEKIKVLDREIIEIEDITPSSLEGNQLELNFDSNLGTNIGTKAHHVLEVIDYNNVSLKSILEIEDLPLKTAKSILKIFDNEIFKEAIKADYHREYPFYHRQGNSIIHGFIDFVSFLDDKIILVDYKSDNLDDENEFIERYQNQLLSYQDVLRQNFDKPIETYIYSLNLAKMIEVKE